MWRPRLSLAVVACLLAGGAFAHGAETHAPRDAPALPAAVTPLPWDIGGPFDLIDHTGALRSQVDHKGRLQLLFFGYANCPGICSAALPLMADTADALADQGIAVQPLLITIDPTLDTVRTMGPKLQEISGDFVGLTGTPEALQRAYDAYQVSFEKIMDDPTHGPIYAHGSHIYLLDGQGKVLTLLPPVLPTSQMAGIIARYAHAP